MGTGLVIEVLPSNRRLANLAMNAQSNLVLINANLPEGILWAKKDPRNHLKPRYRAFKACGLG